MTKVLALERLIEKYRRMPDTVFPYHCRYADVGVAGEQMAYVAIGAPGDAVAEGQDLLSLQVDGRPQDGAIGVSVGAQSGREGKACALYTGLAIASELEALRTALLDHRYAPPGEAARRSSAPHIELVGCAPEPDPHPIRATCPRADRCPVARSCVSVDRRLSLQGLRYGTGRTADVRALQSLLFMLEYGDEMRFERFGTDGVFGARTRLAVEAFARELAWTSRTALPSTPVERVDSTLGAALVRCCTTGWTRPRYHDLDHEEWDLAPLIPTEELDWLKRRYHVRCLQNDLVALRIETADLRAARRSLPMVPERLEQRWASGLFDALTETAVKVFQAAAKSGGRLEPATRRIEYDARRVTFRGEPTGAADRETRAELRRWLAHLSTQDRAETALPIAEVLLPALGCPALAKEQGTFEVLFSIPTERVPAGGLTPQALDQVFALHLPRDPEEPFSFESCPPSGAPAGILSVLRVERVDDPQRDAGLHAGTHGLASGATTVHSSAEPWLECVNGAERETVAARMIALYERAYPAPTHGGARTIFRAVAQLAPGVPAGLYLLHVRGHPHRRPMPVRVFERGRASYRIAHISDLHVSARHDELERYVSGTAYENPNRSVRALFDLLNAERPDLVIITGDLVESAHKHRPTATLDGKLAFGLADIDANWRAFHAMVTCAPGLRIPFFTMLGDRDRAHNPPSVVLSSAPLRLSRSDAAAYPLDAEDVADDEYGFPRSWTTARARADTFHADECASEFYYRHVNPFTRYSVLLDEILMCCVDSGKSSVDSLMAYGAASPEQWRNRLAAMIEGGPPLEPCAGFGDDVTGWITRLAAADPNRVVLLCMHAPPMLFPVTDLELSAPREAGVGTGLSAAAGWGTPDLLEQRGWYSAELTARLQALAPAGPRDWVPVDGQDRAFLEAKQRAVSAALDWITSRSHPAAPCPGPCVEPTEAHEVEGACIPAGECPRALATALGNLLQTLTRLRSASVSHHGLVSGGEQLLSLCESGRVPLVLHGHLHRNRELTCVRRAGRVHWRMTPRSSATADAAPGAEPVICRHLATVSCGHAGTSYVLEGGAVGKAFDTKGFRELVLASDGRLVRCAERFL